MIAADLYDPHSSVIGSKEYDLQVDAQPVKVRVRSPSEKSIEADFVFLCDELAGSKFIHYFPKSRRVALLKKRPQHCALFGCPAIGRSIRRKDLLLARAKTALALALKKQASIRTLEESDFADMIYRVPSAYP